MRRWKLVINYALIVVFIFGLARALSVLNEYYGSSNAEIQLFEVVGKRTRFVLIPVSVLDLKAKDGGLHKIEVLSELFGKTKVGDKIEVALSHGALGRDWLQDRAFYESLKQTRQLSGFIYIVLFILLSFFCYKQICVLGYSKRVATFSLVPVISIAYILFYLQITA